MSAMTPRMPKLKMIATLGMHEISSLRGFSFCILFLWPQILLASRDLTVEPIFTQFASYNIISGLLRS